MTYKLKLNSLQQQYVSNEKYAYIPFEPSNSDYQQFKKDIANGVELQDAEGNAMTGDNLNKFIQGLK